MYSKEAPVITEADVKTLCEELRHEFPGFHVVRRFGTGRCGPMLGAWFFVSSAWGSYSPYNQYVILRHEAVHMRQQQRLGLGKVWLGMLPFLFAYLLLPLPVGLAWCRYQWEREAFIEQMQVEAEELGANGLLARREHYVRQFTGKGAYWWCWPFRRSVERWVDSAIALAIHLAEKKT